MQEVQRFFVPGRQDECLRLSRSRRSPATCSSSSSASSSSSSSTGVLCSDESWSCAVKKGIGEHGGVMCIGSICGHLLGGGGGGSKGSEHQAGETRGDVGSERMI